MDDRSKNKDQLIKELEQMRQRVAVLDRAETENERIREDLRKENDELQLILNSVPAFIFYKDSKGRLIRGNAAVVRSADMPKEGWVGKTVFDLLPGLAESYNEDDMKVMTSGKPKRNIIEPFDTPKGVRWLQTTKIPTKDKEGKVNGLVGFSVDITERIRAEEARRESEEKLRAIFDSTSDGIVVVDVEGKVVEANQSALRMTGYSREDVIGRTAFEFLAEGDRSEAEAVMLDGIKQGPPIGRAEYTVVAADGKEFMAEIGSAMLRDDLENVVGFIATFRDITERKQAEMELQNYRDHLEKMVEERTADLTVANRQLKQEIVNRKRAEVAMRDSEERLRTTFESMTEGVLIVDLQGNIAEANRTALDMAKTRKKELIGQNIFEFIAPEERDQAMSELGAVLAAGINRADLEYTFVDAEGKRIDAEFSASLLRDSAGNPAGIIGIARDLTERKRMEKALRESEEKLRFMFESMGDGIVVIDPEGKITEVNQSLVAMAGYQSREQVLSEMPLDSLLRGFAAGQWKISRAGEWRGSPTVEYVAVDRNGKQFDVEAKGAALKDAAGKTAGFIVALRDVSERKRMEQALRDSETRYRELFENLHTGVVVYEATDDGSDFIFRDLNSAAERISKLRREDFLGKSVLQAKPGIKKSGLLDVLRRVWKTGEPEFMPAFFYEDEFVSGWREDYIYRLPTGEVVSVYDDVTERKRADEALRQSEEKYRSLVDHMQEGYVIVRGEHIKYANERCADFLGIPVDKIIGKSIWDFIVPADVEKAKQTGDVFSSGGVTPLQEFSYYREDGRLVPLEVNLKEVSYEGKPAMAVVMRDVTERRQMEKELRESEEKLRTMFETMRDGIVLTDINGRITDVNEAIVRIGGHGSKEKLIGRVGFDLVADKDRDMLAKAVASSLSGGGAAGMWEVKLARGDGTDFEAEMTGAMMRDSSGNPVGFLGVVRDITDRKRMEQAVRESEEKLSAMFASMVDTVVVVDLEGKVTDLNDAGLRMTGYSSKEEVIGKNAFDFIAEEDRDRAVGDLTRSFETGPGFLVQYKLVDKDGKIYDVEAAGSMLYDSDGKVTGFINVVRDITERKRILEELRQSEEKLRAIFASMIDAVAVIDMDGRIKDLNDAALRLTGYSTKEEVVGENAFDFIADEDRARAIKDMTKALETEPGFTVQYKFMDKDGKGYDVEATGNIMLDSDGNVTGLVAVVRDITERMRMQEELRQSEEKLRFMFASIIDAIVVVDLEGRILDLNDAGLRLIGYSDKGELIGHNAFDFIAEEDRERALNDMLKSFEVGPGFEVQYRFRNKQGDLFYVEARGGMLYDFSGKVTGHIVIVRDVTERRQMVQSLRESEEKLRSMFDAIGDAVTITDLKGTILEENEAAVRIAGFDSKDELIGMNGFELIAEKDRDRAVKTMLSGFKQGDTLSMGYALLRKDGSQWDGDASLALMRDSSGKPMGVVAVTKDVTERKRMQEELRQSEEKLRAIFESIGDAIIVIGIEGTIQDANAEACRMLGCRNKAEVVGKRAWEFLNAGDRSRSKEYSSRLFDAGQAGTMEFMLKDPEGRDIYVESRSSLIHDTAGRPIGLVGISRDVTERRRMEDALRDSEEKLRTMFEAIEDGITVTDLKGNIVQHNEAARRMLGYGRKDKFNGKKGMGFIAKKDRARAEGYMRGVVEEGRVGTIEYALVAKDGTELDAEVHATLIRDASGNPAAVVGVARDVTERKRMQEALRESEEKLRFMFDSIADGMILVDLSGNVQEANAAAARMAGFSDKEEMIGRNAFDFIAERDRDRALAENMKNIAEGRGSSVLYTAVDRHGNEVTAEAVGAMLRDAAGSPTGFITVVRDISERMRMQEALRESEEKLRFMFNSIADGVVSVDLQGKIQDANPAFIRMTGYGSKEEMVGSNAFDLVAPRDMAKAQEQFVRDMGVEQIGDLEYLVKAKSGGEFDAEVSAGRLCDAEGKAAGFMVAVRDISERKRWQEELRRSEERLRFMFESMGDAIVLIDLEGKITELNERLIVMSGYESREEVLGRNAFEFVTERDRAKAMEDFVRNAEQQISATIEYVAVDRHGKEFDVEANGAMLRDVAGKPAGFIIALRDVSERKRMQEELRKSEERLRFMFESMGDAIVVIDLEGKITEVNERLVAMSGYESREEVLGEMPLNSLLRGFALGQWEISRTMGRQMSATVEYTAADRQGREFDVEANGAMLRDAAGKPAGFIIALRDVSERKLMEQRLRDSEEMARGMLESAAAGIYLVQNGSFEYVSPLFASISGYSSDELMGTQALGYVHPDDRDMVREKAIESLRGQSTLPYEFRFVQKDGTIVWMLEKVASIQYKGKRATIASIMDITERKRAEQALRESEEKLRSFMDSATDYFTIWDSKLTLIDLNEAALRYPIVDFPGKLRKESLVGKNILKLEPTIRETDRYDRYMEVIRTGKPFFAEDIIPHTKLGDVHMAISAFRVGEGLGIITTDVTERRRSEEELRRSKVDLEKRTNQLLALQKVTASIQSTLSLSDVLQQVAEGVVDMGYDQSMVIVVDEKADVYRARAYFSKDRPKYREGVESIVEQALVDIHFPRKRGYSMGVDESLDGKVVITPNFSALAVPPLTKQQANAVQKFLGANTIVSMPLFAMERHVGGILAFTARDDITETDVEPLRLLADQAGVAIVNANIYEGAAEMAQRLAVTGTLSRILGSSLDIREVYQAFIDEIHNVIDFERASIALVDGDQLQFLAVSPDVGPGGDTVMPAAGSPTEWVIRHKQTNIEHDLTAERQFSIDDVYVEEGMRSAIRVPLISKGEAFGSFNLVSRSRNAYGEREQGILEQVAGSIAAAIENSRLFTRVRQHEAELVKAYDELKKAQEYMVQAERLRALGELAGGVAHDFNNILAVILGRAQLALEDVKDAKLKKDLKIIEQTALDAATTVRRLQDFARVRVDRGFETVDLNELVEDALQMVESRRMELKETRGVIIGVNTDLGEVPSVQGQAAELREALLNILFNAIDAMPKGGSLTVNSKKDKAGVVLSISDTGEGIPDDVRSKIFDPFFTTRPQKGSGLGLSVTYGIITRHGGKIHCASEVGKGTTFYIWLPVTAGVKAEKPPQKKLVGVKSAEVLLVDDDPDVSEVMQRMLQQMGHRVTAVNSGEEAVNIFESGHYDLVVTDLGMPDMSGREVAAAVKDIKPGTPVLLITGWGVQLDQSELPEIDGIVAKPFSKEVLREQLAKLLPGDGGLSEGKSRKKKGPR